jgi:outer membrane protein assembly factor BamC
MIALGTPQAQAQAAVNTPADKPLAHVATVDNRPVVVIDEAFDRAWRRVGLALDRTGFTVEDRDRSQGTYFVRYVPPTDKKEPSFLAKLFTRENAEPPLKFRINLKTEGQTTTVSVLDANGTPDKTANAQRIVQVIADDLK